MDDEKYCDIDETDDSIDDTGSYFIDETDDGFDETDDDILFLFQTCARMSEVSSPGSPSTIASTPQSRGYQVR